MHRFQGNDIEITRGDSLMFRIRLSGRDLPEGSVGLFTVKAHPRDAQPLIQKRMSAGTEELLIHLTPKETDLLPRTYFWDVRVLIPLESGGYELETPMEYAAFTVLEAVGHDFGVEEDPGMDGDVPVLSQLIAQTRGLVEEITLARDSGAFTGPAGQPGKSPVVGENGCWHVWDEAAQSYQDTGVYAGGEAPHIGDNGNWYLGSNDTGVPATGEAAQIEAVYVSVLEDGGEPGGDARLSGTGGKLKMFLDFYNLRGERGAAGNDGQNGQDGKDGQNGKDGVGIQSVTQTTTSTADGGTNVITVQKTDGTSSSFNVRNGTRGSAGPAGADGKTPVKGTDYFTSADQAAMVEQVKNSLTIETWTFTLQDGSSVNKKVAVG